MPTRYLVPREVARRLKVSDRTIRRWIAKGLLPALKVGKTIRINETDFLALASPITRPKRPQDDLPAITAVSEEVLSRTWDNPEDAIYDRWREHYGVPEG